MPTDDGSARRATRLLWATLVAGLLVLLAILEGSDDCLDPAVVTLRAPLGTRAVVDGSSGAVVALSAPD